MFGLDYCHVLFPSLRRGPNDHVESPWKRSILNGRISGLQTAPLSCHCTEARHRLATASSCTRRAKAEMRGSYCAAMCTQQKDVWKTDHVPGSSLMTRLSGWWRAGSCYHAGALRLVMICCPRQRCSLVWHVLRWRTPCSGCTIQQQRILSRWSFSLTSYLCGDMQRCCFISWCGTLSRSQCDIILNINPDRYVEFWSLSKHRWAVRHAPGSHESLCSRIRV